MPSENDVGREFMIPNVVVTKTRDTVFIFSGPDFSSGGGAPVGSRWNGVRGEEGWPKGNLKTS